MHQRATSEKRMSPAVDMTTGPTPREDPHRRNRQRVLSPRARRPPAPFGCGRAARPSRRALLLLEPFLLFVLLLFLLVHPAAVRCDMVLHRALRARRLRKTGFGGEVRHGVTSGVKRVIHVACVYYLVYLLLLEPAVSFGKRLVWPIQI